MQRAFVAPALVRGGRPRTLRGMNTHRSIRELAVWAALAFAGGSVAGWMSTGASEVQGSVLTLMLAAFALTLPGRAPALLVAVASAVAFPVVHLYQFAQLDLRFLIVIVPAAIGAYGGRLAGTLLDTAASQLAAPLRAAQAPWNGRPLSKRFVLAVALPVIAAVGLPSVSGRLHALGHPAAAWLSIVWQTMTLLGWIGLTPLILRARGMPDTITTVQGLTPAGAVKHIVSIGALTIIHSASVVLISAALFVPVVPSWGALVLAAFVAYLPLDLLVYVTILTLGYISDTERQRRDAVQREAMLRAESVESRLSALRARLNPHFLFNALNSVDVLARAEKTDQLAKVIDGVTGLLRYVLDERRPHVTLREELEFVQRYLEVQQVRFGDRLRYSIVVHPAAGAAMVPQLLLQPIVENAVEHGIGNTLEGGAVCIEAMRDGEGLQVILDDEGAGMAADGASDGIGLSSTRERLSRLFGGRASLRIESRSPARGTRAVIRIPYQGSDSA